jgi:hypothetical protein
MGSFIGRRFYSIGSSEIVDPNSIWQNVQGRARFTGLQPGFSYHKLLISTEAEMNHILVFPMFAVVVLTFMVGVITFRTRVRAARTGAVDFRYFKTFSVGTPPQDVLQTTRHFNNLFEVPTLFYAACLAGMIVGLSGVVPLIFAWIFVAARVAHAWIHLGSNKLQPRIASFFLGFFSMFALWVCVVVKVCQDGI